MSRPFGPRGAPWGKPEPLHCPPRSQWDRGASEVRSRGLHAEDGQPPGRRCREAPAGAAGPGGGRWAGLVENTIPHLQPQVGSGDSGKVQDAPATRKGQVHRQGHPQARAHTHMHTHTRTREAPHEINRILWLRGNLGDSGTGLRAKDYFLLKTGSFGCFRFVFRAVWPES